MATPTRRGRRAATPETETVQESTVTETPSETPSETDQLTEKAESTESGATEERKPGRKPMDEAERQKRATYRACVKAKELLEENGFKVTEPEGWEDPEAERLRENARRALEALQKAGIDPASVTTAEPAPAA